MGSLYQGGRKKARSHAHLFESAILSALTHPSEIWIIPGETLSQRRTRNRENDARSDLVHESERPSKGLNIVEDGGLGMLSRDRVVEN